MDGWIDGKSVLVTKVIDFFFNFNLRILKKTKTTDDKLLVLYSLEN